MATETVPQAASDSPPADCYIVEDNPAVARFIARALRDFAVTSLQLPGVRPLIEALKTHHPKLVFLDISLGDSDAIDAIRALTAAGFHGVVQLMSGSNTGLLADVRQVGERHGLAMRPVLAKPFRVDAVKLIVEEESLSGVRPGPAPVPKAESDVARQIGGVPEISLGEALDRNWVELWYQPKFELTNGRMVGAEGLARVRHPELGLLSPASFIPPRQQRRTAYPHRICAAHGAPRRRRLRLRRPRPPLRHQRAGRGADGAADSRDSARVPPA